MRTVLSAVVLLATVALAGATRAQDKPAAVAHLAPLERFAGEWTVEGKWSDGNSLHARTVYEWGLNKKVLRASTFVRKGDTEYQRYEGVLAWHPEKKSLFQISFAYDGSMTETIVESVDQDTLHIGWVPYHGGKPSKVRQVIKFLDRDHFQWTVQLQDGEEWKQLIDATWKRTR
jgi:hypothetical protein